MGVGIGNCQPEKCYDGKYAQQRLEITILDAKITKGACGESLENITQLLLEREKSQRKHNRHVLL